MNINLFRLILLISLYSFLGFLVGSHYPIFYNEKLDIEFWAYIAGTVVALCALFLTVWQAHTTRNHNKMSVRPALTATAQLDNENGFTFELSIKNNGLGPALIKKAYIKTDIGSEEFEIKRSRIIAMLYQMYDPYDVMVDFLTLTDSSIIDQKEKRLLFRVYLKDASSVPLATLEAIINISNKFIEESFLFIKYESLYKETFYLDERIYSELED